MFGACNALPAWRHVRATGGSLCQRANMLRDNAHNLDNGFGLLIVCHHQHPRSGMRPKWLASSTTQGFSRFLTSKKRFAADSVMMYWKFLLKKDTCGCTWASARVLSTSTASERLFPEQRPPWKLWILCCLQFPTVFKNSVSLAHSHAMWIRQATPCLLLISSSDSWSRPCVLSGPDFFDRFRSIFGTITGSIDRKRRLF